MPAAAREYLSRKGIGELHALEQLLAEVAAEVRDTFDSQSSNRRANFFARILVNEQESEEEGITKDEVESHSKGVYPFLWLIRTSIKTEMKRGTRVDDYADLYRKLGLGDVAARIVVGDLSLPIEVAPPPEHGFPPALLPLWFSNGIFVGFWKHWFSSRNLTVVRHYAYEGWITKEWVRSFPQLACMVILEAIDLDGEVEEETLRFAREVGLEQDVPFIAEVWRDRGWRGLVEHAAFGGESPRSLLRPSDTYRGDFPDADMEMSVERLRNTCSYEVRGQIGGRIDPMDNGGRFQARLGAVADVPPWLQTIDQPPVFAELLAASDYLGAWMSLNSVGWTYGEAKVAIRKLAAVADNPQFEEFAEVWSNGQHVVQDTY